MSTTKNKDSYNPDVNIVDFVKNGALFWLWIGIFVLIFVFVVKPVYGAIQDALFLTEQAIPYEVDVNVDINKK